MISILIRFKEIFDLCFFHKQLPQAPDTRVKDFLDMVFAE
jgi:hypothetical protein